jgi:SAM-dependent methyltransferase
MPANSEPRHYMRCPVCASPIKTWRVKVVERESYNLDICGSCGYAFVNPRPSASRLMAYYASVGHGNHGAEKKAPSAQSVLAGEQNDPNSTLDARRIVNTVKSLGHKGPGERFLDVGCGYGFFAREAAAAGFDVLALELAEREREIAKELTGQKPMACSFEEFDCAAGSFSVVCMSQILEHAGDVDLWIEKANRALVNGGILAVALPNFGSLIRRTLQERDPYLCPPAHLNFFNPGNLSNLLEKHGFKVETLQWVSRLPKSTFEKRLPPLGKPLVPVIGGVASVFLKMMDALHLGVMISVYGRKVSPGKQAAS